MRSGEAMEQGLRDCCRSIRIGKILIQSDEDTHEAKVFYAKFPSDIHERKVLLMYPIMSKCGAAIVGFVNWWYKFVLDEFVWADDWSHALHIFMVIRNLPQNL